MRIPSVAQPVDHLLGDQADTLLGAAEALCVERRVLSHHQPIRDADAAIHDDIEQPRAAPDRMQPPETREEIASPRRPSRSCTNFAGGVISA